MPHSLDSHTHTLTDSSSISIRRLTTTPACIPAPLVSNSLAVPAWCCLANTHELSHLSHTHSTPTCSPMYQHGPSAWIWDRLLAIWSTPTCIKLGEDMKAVIPTAVDIQAHGPSPHSSWCWDHHSLQLLALWAQGPVS